MRRHEPSAAPNRVLNVAGGGDRSTAADEELLRALWTEHGGPLLAYATRLTGGDRQRAEDIVQETMLRAWRHPEALQADRGSPRPWLCTVARNIAVDAHRSRQARPPEVGPDALSLVAVPDDVDRVLEAWIVSDALRALSPEHREVIVETYSRGKSVADAAATLRVPAGTVKSRTYYALRALRLELTERGVTS